MAITRLGPNQDITAAKIAGQINFKNLIINGDMSVSQRTTSEASVNSIRYSACDRWYTNPQNIGTYTISQDTDVPSGQGFAKSYKVACTTADASPAAGDIFQIQQRIEGQMLQQIKKGTANAESLTLSFWVKSNLTTTFGVTLQDNDNSRIIGSTFTINTTNTWEKKTITFAGDTTGALDNDNANSLQLQFCLGTGSTYSGTDNTSWGAYANGKLGYGVTGNIASSTSNNFWITGVQLEADTSASDFEFLPYDVNLMRCQRYYYERVAEDAYGPGVQGMQIGASDTMIQGYHPIKMRAAPSMSVSGTWVMEVGTTSVAWTCPSTRTSTTAFSSQQSAGNSDGSAAIVYSNNNTASAIIGDAEL